MKIVIAAEIFPPEIGGPATYSQKLATELTKRGFAVKLICYSQKQEPAIDQNLNFFITRILRGKGTFKNHYLRYFFKLLLLAKDCDLIYAQGPVSSGWPSVFVKKILRKKLMVKVVGDYAWEQARNLGLTDIGIDEFQNQELDGKIGKLKNIEKWVCQKSDKVIIPSQYLKNIVQGWGVSGNKIELVYTSFKLIILGSGPEEEKLLKEARDLNLLNTEDVVIMQSDQLGVISYLRQAYTFVLNTGYEGLSHTILEAMTAGAPVITTNVGGNPELIQDGYNGLLIEYNNKAQLKEAILKLYRSEELRNKFIENSKKVLEKFSFANMINQTINLFNQLTK